MYLLDWQVPQQSQESPGISLFVWSFRLQEGLPMLTPKREGCG